MNLNNKKTILSKKYFVYAMAFFIPVAIMLLVSFFSNVYPFGNNTFLISDCGGQYINYLSYFKTIFTDNNNFLYTFSKNMGGSAIDLFAYYLMSPLNLLCLLCPNEYLPVAVFLIVIIKIGLCGLTFNWFINNKYPFSLKSLIFSTSYALMGYNMAYFWDIMWLEGVILLPIIIFGIEKMISGKKPYMYILALTAALITNYYIGWMLCIFSVVYFVFKLILCTGKICDFKLQMKTIAKFIVSSLTSVGLSAFWLVPVFLSLQGGKAKFSLATLTFKENYKFIDVFTKLYSNTINKNQMIAGLPNIYCGIFIVVLVILYFLNSNIKLKEKLVSAGIISIMLISFHINTFNLIYHGFNEPVGFLYRYSFTLSFLLILIAYRSFIYLKSGINNKNILHCALIFIVATLIIFKNNYDFIRIKCVYFDVFLMLGFCILIYSYITTKTRKDIVITIAAFLQIGGLFLNAFLCMKSLQVFGMAKMDEYKNYVCSVDPVVNKIKEEDKTFYRLEKTFKRTNNDPMQFNYNGLSHFSSCEKTFVKSFLGKMGFRNSGNWAYYNNGSTVSVDSFLGVKYLASKDKLKKDYEYLFSKNDINVYRNPYALPLGIVSSDKILDLDIKSSDLFEIQNNIFNCMSDSYDDIFNNAEVVNVDLENLSLVAESGNTKKYQKLDSNKKAFIKFNLNVTDTNALYTYINAPKVQKTKIYINDLCLGDYFDTYRWDIVNLGKFSKGETVIFKIELLEKDLTINDALFYYENLDILKQKYNQLSSQKCVLEKISSAHLAGNVNVLQDNQYLLFTIPYEKDWHIKIDGKKVTPIKAADTLLSVPIDKGMHEIDLKYIPRGLYLGIGVSAITLFMFIGTIIYNKNKRHN